MQERKTPSTVDKPRDDSLSVAQIIKRATAGIQKETDKLIIVTGCAGSGMSTLINNLCGIEYERKVDDCFEAYLTPKSGRKQEPARAQLGASYCTLYPQVIVSDGISYCDTPGFGARHFFEKSVCPEIGMPLAIYHAKSVSGLVITLSWDSLEPRRSARAESQYRQLAQSLFAIFKNRSDIKDNIAFVITHPPGYARREKFDLKVIRRQLLARLCAFENNLSKSAQAEFLFVNLMKDNLDKTFIIRGCKDEDEITDDRELLIQHIKNIVKNQKPIPKSFFDFDISHKHFDSIRIWANSLIFDVLNSSDMITGVSSYMSDTCKLIKYKEKETGVKKTDSSFQLFSLDKPGTDPASLRSRFAELNDRLQKYQKEFNEYALDIPMLKEIAIVLNFASNKELNARMIQLADRCEKVTAAIKTVSELNLAEAIPERKSSITNTC